MREIPYPKPGEILLHEFLEPMGISAYRLAKDALAEVLARIEPLQA
jgi:plasmid maintenance system antidote protein VapI